MMEVLGSNGEAYSDAMSVCSEGFDVSLEQDWDDLPDNERNDGALTICDSGDECFGDSDIYHTAVESCEGGGGILDADETLNEDDLLLLAVAEEATRSQPAKSANSAITTSASVRSFSRQQSDSRCATHHGGNKVIKSEVLVTSRSDEDLQGELYDLRARAAVIEQELVRRATAASKGSSESSHQIARDPQRSGNAMIVDSSQKTQTSGHGLSQFSILHDHPIDFGKPSPDNCGERTSHPAASEVHTGLSDSSEDEEQRHPDCGQRQLSKEGRFLKQRIAQDRANCAATIELRKKARTVNSKVFYAAKPAEASVSQMRDASDYYDDFFQIKILSPKMSSVTFADCVGHRNKIQLSQVRKCSSAQIGPDSEWVTMGVIINKLPPKTSAKGSKFAIWKICDLVDCSQMVTLFLFGECYTTHCKLGVGSVFALLNAIKMEQSKEYANDFALKIDHPQKLLELGMSKDMSFCKGKKRDGNSCTNVVNRSKADHCDFHVYSAGKKLAGRRAELQTPGNRVPRAIEQKLYVANDASSDCRAKDRVQRTVPLAKVTLTQVMGGRHSAAVTDVLAKSRQRCTASAIEELPNSGCTLATSETSNEFVDLLRVKTAGSRNLIRHLETEDEQKQNTNATGQTISFSEFMKSKGTLSSNVAAAAAVKLPMLGRGLLDANTSRAVEFEQSSTAQVTPVTPSPSYMTAAKKRAMSYVRKNGAVMRTDPNVVGKRKQITTTSAKRPLPADVTANAVPVGYGTTETKRARLGDIDLNDPGVQTILKKQSSFASQLVADEAQREENYFKAMEAREKAEQRTTQIMKFSNCKVVSCKQCSYTASKQSKLCADLGHQVVAHVAEKRFYRCIGCSWRVECYGNYPINPCSKCGARSFRRVALKEEQPTKPMEQLKIRGDEVKFANR